MNELTGRNVPQPIDQAPAVQTKQRATRVKEVTLPDGRTGWQYSDGSLRYDNGTLMQRFPGTEKYAISNDNARELLARRRLIGLRAQLRGLAKAEGVDPSEIEDELLLQAGSALEALTLHMASTFKRSNSLRGMAEVYGVLAAPLVGDRRQKDEGDGAPSEQQPVVMYIAQYIQNINAPAVPNDVVDGTVSD